MPDFVVRLSRHRQTPPISVQLGFQVKASPNVREDDARGLLALARRVGKDRCTGVLLHTGRHAFRLAGVLALPIASLWRTD